MNTLQAVVGNVTFHETTATIERAGCIVFDTGYEDEDMACAATEGALSVLNAEGWVIPELYLGTLRYT